MRLCILLFVILVSGCATQRRCLTKFPPQTIIERTDSIITRDTVIYKDIVIRDTILADTVFKEKVINVPKELTILPVEAENNYARAKAWIENSRLRLQLTQKEQVIQRIIENAEKQETFWREEYYKERIKESHTVYKTRPIHKIAMLISGVSILLATLFVYIKFK